MTDLAVHQVTAVDELVEWWEDLHDRSTGSQLVCLVAPTGWGRTTVLDALAERVATDGTRLGTVLRLLGREAPDGLAMQIAWLGEVLDGRGFLPHARRELGLDRAESVIETGLGVLGLVGLLTGLPGLVAGLPASLALSVAGSARDRSTAGQLAQVARLAHAAASYSTSLAVALLIDDADLLDPGLVEHFVFTILDRTNSNVLVVIAAAPDTPVLARFSGRWRYGPRWERIGFVDVDPTMDESGRRRLVETAAEGWPAAAVDRLAARARSFSDIWEALQLPAAGDLARLVDADEQLRLVDRLVSQVNDPGVPPPAARVLGWAGGLMHELQLAAAVTVLDGGGAHAGRLHASPWLARLGRAVRFAHPAYRPTAERSASVLSRHQRGAMASAVTAVARQLCAESGSATSRVDLICALRPVLHLATDGDIETGADIGELLARLACEVEALGDPCGAFEVAKTTLDLLDTLDPATESLHARFLALVLRLGQVCGNDDAAERAAAVAEAMEAGAAIGLEANVWRAITLLDRPATRPDGAQIVDALALELTSRRASLGEAGTSWRLLLALHAGRAGYLSLAEVLLAPLLESPEEPEPTRDAAYQILATVSGGPGADVRIYRQALLAMYQQLDESSDVTERLAIVSALADANHRSGADAHALRFGKEQLEARLVLFHPDHPDTLTTRANVASWTGKAGDAREALALFEALLPDMTRVLGPDHPKTLTIRHNVAFWTGEAGDAREALALLEALLPDMARVLGPDHPDTLTTRRNVATWTGEAGDAREALALFEALLPDMARVLGPDHPDHPDTLTTRANVASWTGEAGDAREALALFEALLPDMARVLGPDHPDTLASRHNVATWTGKAGDAREALALFEALLPDRARVLGPDHPDTLTTRANVATWTGKAGDAREALALFEALLPDMARVLGPDHPDTLTTRANVATWTGEDDARQALALSEALLPDMARVLGPDHPDTLITRHNVASWTGETGDAREALALSEALLPDMARVLGPDHPDTLGTARLIDTLRAV